MTSPLLIDSTAETWSRADWIAFWSLIVSFVGIIATIHRGNKNSSVASMIPLNAEIRDAYDRYRDSFAKIDFQTTQELESLEGQILINLERLMNILELAAAIEVEGTLSGVSRNLMRSYLQRILDLLIEDEYTNNNISNLLQNENTYIFIRRFLRLRYRSQTSVVLPPAWYAYPDVSLFQRAKSFFRY